MSPLVPFAYPPEPQRRRHGPVGCTDYSNYKPWLRDEFQFRCVYCLEREVWYPDQEASFSVDHVIPQSIDRSRVCEYANLLYACTRCNAARTTETLLDPTVVALGLHLCLGQDGHIDAMTAEGQDLIDLLHLNANPALRVRRSYLLLLSLKDKHPNDEDVHQLYLSAFGYPENLPDLRALRPPGGNLCKNSEDACYHARRVSGRLPSVF